MFSAHLTKNWVSGWKMYLYVFTNVQKIAGTTNYYTLKFLEILFNCCQELFAYFVISINCCVVFSFSLIKPLFDNKRLFWIHLNGSCYVYIQEKISLLLQCILTFLCDRGWQWSYSFRIRAILLTNCKCRIFSDAWLRCQPVSMILCEFLCLISYVKSWSFILLFG